MTSMDEKLKRIKHCKSKQQLNQKVYVGIFNVKYKKDLNYCLYLGFEITLKLQNYELSGITV